MLYTIA
jgi:cation-transporting P-type ATPase 13A2